MFFPAFLTLYSYSFEQYDSKLLVSYAPGATIHYSRCMSGDTDENGKESFLLQQIQCHYLIKQKKETQILASRSLISSLTALLAHYRLYLILLLRSKTKLNSTGDQLNGTITKHAGINRQHLKGNGIPLTQRINAWPSTIAIKYTGRHFALQEKISIQN